ncbi:polyketide synthase PksA [Rhizodiscina lignyota]|uniref:Polyketide synthase PksA n=1 Tax=Rhizodiscina lignyota TaxID=1504668 RepID=A0A9P4ICK1_9PEZI|nr:polyketide synthase PksA [Rhizodiscina lignyota]
MNVLIFGDQTADQYGLLRKIVTRKDNTLLTTFLERVSVALREEVQKLPRTQRDQVPDFLTVNQLIEAYYEKGQKIPQVESALVTIAQLAHYIGYYGENPTELPNAANTRLIGLCTGLLAASAVACSKSLTDLLPLAIEASRVSFRAGYTTSIVRNGLEQSAHAQESWSTIVTGTSEQGAKAALADFHAKNGIAPSSQAYISAVSVMAITISGPPSVTRRIFSECEAFTKNHKVPIPVFAPYHAGHLYSDADIAKILDKTTTDNLKFFRPAGLIHSAVTGKCQTANSALELFQSSLKEMLLEPVRWDFLLEEVVSQVTATSKAECHVSAMGVTNVANSLVSALKAGGQASVVARDHTAWTENKSFTGRTQNDKIAIVGMAGRFPGAASADALWELLEKGLDVHREVPADRFDAKAHCDPSGKGKNKSHTPYGCFIDEPGLFDPRFFNMSPREAAQTDPMGRLALTTAYEALEMSGYVPNRTPSTKLHRIGTFYGQTSDDWREINASENVDTYYITGGVRAFAPGRINYYFKFSGPSYSIDTACSSSLAAVQLACTSLWAGDCDTACAGGLNVLTNPDIFAGLSKGQFLSKTGSCKTYDNAADGYCRGDGCATVVLKRYEDAIADKDLILGCILGAATNHSAEAVSITHPHAGAQEFLYKKVLAAAGVDAHDISYVEMHGTGTQAGDGIEMTSVTNSFAPRHRQRRPDQTLHLGAIKANIGHGEAASGTNSLVKVLMMMKKNAIPANVGIKGIINQTFPKDLKERNVHISTTQVPWHRKGAEPRKLFLNNFSAAGGNTAIILEDGPLMEAPKGVDPRSQHMISISARSIASLKRNIDNLQTFLKENPETTLPSLAYTTTARRIQHNYRIAFAVDDISKVSDALKAQVKETYSPIAMVPTKVAFTFTGQGSQYTALGKKLYEDLSTFRADIDQLDNLARIQGLPSFIPLLDGTDVLTLSPTVVQLGMACIQVALARMWASWGVTPTAVVGHSLGEYAALHVAGVISASDMILLVGRRAQLLEKECTPYTHGMLAVKGSVESIQNALGAKMTEVACINGPEETVLCGNVEAVAAAGDILAKLSFKSTKLNVPFAFHSAQVDPILEGFKEVAKGVTFNKPVVPVLSPLTGDVVREVGVIGPDYLARHARETVNFWSAVSSGLDEKAFDEKTAWLEIGAHPVCSGMVRASLSGNATTAPSLRRNEDPWKTLSNSLVTLYLAGVAVDFNEYHREFNDAHELYHLPTYSFDNKRYWLDYHNNWTLTKGEAPVAPAPVAAPAPVMPLKSKLSTTSCQRIVFEELHANSGSVIVQSDLADEKLHKAVSGHVVNDAPLCPSSLYADQAMTIADYLWQQLRPGTETPGLDVCDMEVHKPLVAAIPPPPEGQHFQIEAHADMEAGEVHLKFRTVTPDGKLMAEHGHGLVKYEDKEAWLQSWNKNAFMVQTQVDLLKQKLQTGAAHKVLRGMAYKLFKALVTYAPAYRGMEEVILDGQQTEATAKIKFQTTEADGKFFCAPYWIDSLAHISGFIVNGTDLVDSSQTTYISHGWKSIKLAREVSADKEYRSYVRMQPQPNNVSMGDVYIFEGEEIIGLVEGLKFQGVPRKAMDVLVPPTLRNKAAGKPAAAPVKAVLAPKASAPVKAAAPVKTSRPAPKVKAAPKPKAVKAPKAAGGSSITSRVMKIIASETDVDMSELVDEAAFENLGVDSLMSLTISAKFREDLNLEISSSLFTDNPTVGEMKKFFNQYDGDAPAADEADSEDDSSEVADDDDEVSTPASSAPSSAPSLSGKRPVEVEVTVTATASSSGPSVARRVVAEEMGVDVSEITDKAELSEMGMDSLMSLTILGALREQTGIDLPSEFLITNNTIEEIENALGMRPKAAEQAKVSSKATKPSKSPQLSQVSRKLKPFSKDISGLPNASSILLQGNAKIATKKLFLLPDGSGSAASYMFIPNMSSDLAVYGLNCPYMKEATNWQCGVDGVCAIYIKEIKRRQPEGPYTIGGWSAGGVMAYEVAYQLTAMGDEVERLILIDAPNPVMAQEPIPPRLHAFLGSIGMLGTGKGALPDWILPHFRATVGSLGKYEALPFPEGQGPKTFCIWAQDGICGDPNGPQIPPGDDGPETAPMTWLLTNRTDFGHNGWGGPGGLLNDKAIQCASMPGNHFTMMRDENAKMLGDLIKRGAGL